MQPLKFAASLLALVLVAAVSAIVIGGLAAVAFRSFQICLARIGG